MQLPADGVFDRVERILLPPKRSYLNAFLALFGSLPLQVAYYRSAKFAHAVDHLMQEHDGILSHLIRCAEYVKHTSKPKILEMTDAISLNYERVRKLKGSGGFKGFVYRYESTRLLAYEKQIIDVFDLSILVSETDKNYLVGSYHDHVLVCSNGVALEHLSFKERVDSQPVIVYIGNMTSLQNMDACLYFARDVMPRINGLLDAKFRVVGRITDGDAAKLRSIPNVEVTGIVDDIGAAVADARMAVCPVRLAAGVQNKVLEYMALGLPVVTSSMGLEGFSAEPERDLLVADSQEEYVNAINRIWHDPILRSQFAVNGRAYVDAQHKWRSRLSPLVERVTALVNNNS